MKNSLVKQIIVLFDEFEKNYKLAIDAEGYRFKEKNIIIPYRADIFEYVMDIVPNKDEIISIVDSTAFVDAVQKKRSAGNSMTNSDSNNGAKDQGVGLACEHLHLVEYPG